MMQNDRDAMIDQDHLREMIEVISGELELRPLLTIIVQKACELLHADRGSIGLVDSEENAVKIEAIYKMPPEELGSATKRGVGLAGMVYSRREPILFNRYGDLTSRQLPGMDEDTVLGMPIMWRGDIIGTFGIGAGPSKRFGDNDIRMLGVFARHAAIAINNARSYESEKKYAALKERQRLARELHDNVSQLIFSMSLVAQSIASGFEQNKEEGQARISRLLEIAGLAQEEMKALLAELKGRRDKEMSMAALARRSGLCEALKHHSALVTPEGASVVFNIQDDIALSDNVNETLLRIAQEAMANAFRHGDAKNISISLVRKDTSLQFLIENDGRSLEPKNQGQPASTHIGVASMGARAASLGGQLQVENRPEGGVFVEVLIPLP